MALIDDLINDVPAVFPTLRHVETIARAAGAQHHLLIEADAWRHSKVKGCCRPDPKDDSRPTPIRDAFASM